MGNSSAIQRLCSGNTFAKKYRHIGILNDAACGEMALVEDPTYLSGHTYGLKTLLFYEQEACQSAQLSFLDGRRKHENIVHVIEAQVQAESNLCAKLYRMEYVFEYSQKNLFQDLSVRRVCNKPFAESELWMLLQSLLGGAIHLHRVHETTARDYCKLGQLASPTTDIRLQSVFVFESDETLQYKLIDPEISRLPPLSDLILKHDQNFALEGVYLAPENLQCLRNQLQNNSNAKISSDTQKDKSNRNIFQRLFKDEAKADVFTLGVIILAAASLDTMQCIYDYSQLKINEIQLKQKLTQNIKGKFSDNFYKTIRKMLSLDIKKRLDLMQLAESVLLLDHTQQQQNIGGAQNSAKKALNDVTNLSIKSFDMGGVTTAAYFQDGCGEGDSLHQIGAQNAVDVIDSCQDRDFAPKTIHSKNQRVIRDTSVDKENTKQNSIVAKENPQAISQFVLHSIKSSFQQEEVIKLLGTTQELLSPPPVSQSPGDQQTLQVFKTSDAVTARQRALQQLSEVQQEIQHLKSRYMSVRTVTTPKSNTQQSAILSKITYEDGSQYEGEVLLRSGGAQPLRHGKGKLIYSDGAYYLGTWVHNQTSGYGQLYYSSGQLAYEGQWKNDKFDGRGIVYREGFGSNTVAVAGGGLLAAPIDYGNLRHTDELWTHFEGDFVQDERSGSGTMFFANGEKFQGIFANNVPNGQGQFHSKCKGVVRGIWKDGMLTHLQVQAQLR